MREVRLASSPEIERAVAVLRAGGLVAFPTETVYGLGADASSEAAVRRVFAVKDRPQDHPVIVHLPDASHLSHWTIEVPEKARALAAAFWPGPLTLVLKRAPHVSDVVTGGQDTVGLRVPYHGLALDLLRAFDGGIAAPSANRFGRLSPTTAEHVRAELGDDVQIVLDGGPCEVGIESTIVDLSAGVPRLLRPGRISADAIAAVIGTKPVAGGHDAPRAPGRLASHYAPRTEMRLVPAGELAAAIEELARRDRRVAVLSRHAAAMSRNVVEFTAPDNPIDFAKAMYGALRRLDDAGADVLLVEAVPDEPEWLAVRDRLTRAASSDFSDDEP